MLEQERMGMKFARQTEGDEGGSMTLLGTWLMGFLLLVSAMIFVYSNQEIRVSNLERESYQRQLLAESLLEKHLLLLQQDFGLVETILGKRNYIWTILDEGVQGKYIYKVNALHDEAGSIKMAAIVKNQDDPSFENIFSLRWHLEVGADEQTLERSGIG